MPARRQSQHLRDDRQDCSADRDRKERAGYSEAGHQLRAPADVLVSLSTLQLWLSQHLVAPFMADPDIARAS